jgi:hypothetical protein
MTVSIAGDGEWLDKRSWADDARNQCIRGRGRAIGAVSGGVGVGGGVAGAVGVGVVALAAGSVGADGVPLEEATAARGVVA